MKIMKQYVIDELRPHDFEKLKAYLDTTFGVSEVEGLYRIPIEEELLTDIQREHHECGPFYLAAELEPDKLACELLARPKNRIRCNCIGYATEAQRNHFIRRIDGIFEQLEMMT